MESCFFAKPALSGGFLVVPGHLTGKTWEGLHQVKDREGDYLIDPALIAPTKKLAHQSVARWLEKLAGHHRALSNALT